MKLAGSFIKIQYDSFSKIILLLIDNTATINTWQVRLIIIFFSKKKILKYIILSRSVNRLNSERTSNEDCISMAKMLPRQTYFYIYSVSNYSCSPPNLNIYKHSRGRWGYI